MRRPLASLCAAACLIVAALVLAPMSGAATPWFANSVGNATQVVSVLSTGGSNAKMDIYQRGTSGWQALGDLQRRVLLAYAC